MYGTFLPGTSQETDKYGFVNEKEIRIATGITLVIGLFSLFLVMFKGEYSIPMIAVGLIFLDFFLKVFIDPKYAIFGSFVRIFLKNSEPIWVGAVQKRFAWQIGLGISILVLFCLVVQSGIVLSWGGFFAFGHEQYMLLLKEMNITQSSLLVTPITPPVILCVLCLVFMWSESVVGYCVGCSIYKKFVKKGWMKAYPNQNCVNNVCAIPEK